MTTYTITYSTNNSRILDDEQWRALERAGWQLQLYGEATTLLGGGDPPRFLGAAANTATKGGFSYLGEAIEEWRDLTGLDPYVKGCPCCGPPHDFRGVQEMPPPVEWHDRALARIIDNSTAAREEWEANFTDNTHGIYEKGRADGLTQAANILQEERDNG